VCDEIGGDEAESLLMCVCRTVYFRTVQHTHINKDLLIYAASSPPMYHIDYFNKV